MFESWRDTVLGYRQSRCGQIVRLRLSQRFRANLVLDSGGLQDEMVYHGGGVDSIVQAPGYLHSLYSAWAIEDLTRCSSPILMTAGNQLAERPCSFL